LTIAFSYIALLFNSLNIKVMARIWVKGYTKKDGTKVPGHYRDGGTKVADRKVQSVTSKIAKLEAKWKKTRNTQASQRIGNRIAKLEQQLIYMGSNKRK